MVGLLFGFVLFMVDLLLIVAVSRWLWRRGAFRNMVIPLMIGKLAILGGGVYLALVIYQVDPLLFVVGSLLGLLMFSVVCYRHCR